MWLLDTTTLKWSDFPADPPPYAILSHTWGKEEVLFQEIETEGCKTKLGYQKILGCCARAKADGYDYAWVDTCSIDKKSSAELSEAINSMYRWYAEAAVCYVHLADVDSSLSIPVDDQLPGSRYWRRAWTLQELIAPDTVEFFDKHWVAVGTKDERADQIAAITGIPCRIIRKGTMLFSCSSAQKMSWASRRESTRVEDIAYSLMGLFNVNMPLLYGEGSKAFQRLQLQLLSESDDLSLLAWRSPNLLTTIGTTSVLAQCPIDFVNCSHIYERSNWFCHTGSTLQSGSVSSSNLGLSVSLPVLDISGNDLIVFLESGLDSKYVGILVTKDGSSYRRCRPDVLIDLDDSETTEIRVLCLSIRPRERYLSPMDRLSGRTLVHYLDNVCIDSQHQYFLVAVWTIDDGLIRKAARRVDITDPPQAAFNLFCRPTRHLALLFNNRHGAHFGLVVSGDGWSHPYVKFRPEIQADSLEDALYEIQRNEGHGTELAFDVPVRFPLCCSRYQSTGCLKYHELEVQLQHYRDKRRQLPYLLISVEQKLRREENGDAPLKLITPRTSTERTMDVDDPAIGDLDPPRVIPLSHMIKGTWTTETYV